jgi:hypothetical protein
MEEEDNGSAYRQKSKDEDDKDNHAGLSRAESLTRLDP